MRHVSRKGSRNLSSCQLATSSQAAGAALPKCPPTLPLPGFFTFAVLLSVVGESVQRQFEFVRGGMLPVKAHDHLVLLGWNEVVGPSRALCAGCPPAAIGARGRRCGEERPCVLYSHCACSTPIAGRQQPGAKRQAVPGLQLERSANEPTVGTCGPRSHTSRLEPFLHPARPSRCCASWRGPRGPSLAAGAAPWLCWRTAPSGTWTRPLGRSCSHPGTGEGGLARVGAPS